MKQKTKDEVFDLMLIWILGIGHASSCQQVHGMYKKEHDPRYRRCTCGFHELVQLAELAEREKVE